MGVFGGLHCISQFHSDFSITFFLEHFSGKAYSLHHILWFFDKISKENTSLTVRSLSDSGAMCCIGRPCRDMEALSPCLDSPCLEGGFSPFLDGGISPFLEGGFSPFLDGGGSSWPLDGGGLSPCLDPCLDGGT